MNTKKQLLFLGVLIAFLFALAGIDANATIITSAGTGNWNTPATWSPAQVPSSSDDVTITAGHTITVDVNANTNNLSVNGTVQFDGSTRQLAVYGNLTVGTGTFDARGTNTLNLYGSFTNSGTVQTDEYTNIVVGGSGAQLALPALVTKLNNLLINRSNGLTLAAGLEVFGNLTLTNGQLVYGGNTLKIYGNLARTTGTLYSTNSAGEIYLTGSGTTSSLSDTYGTFQKVTFDRPEVLGGNLTVESTLNIKSTSTVTIDGRTLTIKSNFTTDGTGTPFQSNASSNLVVAGTAAQLAFPSLITSFTGNITLNRANGMILAANLALDGNMILTNGALDYAIYTLAISGDLARTAGYFTKTGAAGLGTIKLTGTGSTPNFSTQNWFNSVGANLVNLEVDRSITLVGDLTVTNALTLTSGTLDIVTFTLTINGDGNSIVKTSGIIDATDNASTVVIGGANAMTLPAAFILSEVGALTLTRSNTITLSGNLTCDGTLLLNNAALHLDISTYTLTLNANTPVTPTAGDIVATNAASTIVYGAADASSVNVNYFSTNVIGNLQNLRPLALTAALTVGGTLNLNGNIVTGANVFTYNGNLISRTSGAVNASAGTMSFAGASTTALTVPSGFFGTNSIATLLMTRQSNITFNNDVTITTAATLAVGAGNKMIMGSGNILYFNSGAGAADYTFTSGTIDATVGTVQLGALVNDPDLTTAANYTGSTVNNMTFIATAAPTVLVGAFTITGTLTLNAVTWDITGMSLTIKDLVAGGGSLTTTATTDLTITASTIDFAIPASVTLLQNLTINRTGKTVTLGANLDVSTNVTLTDGTLKIGTGQTLTLSGAGPGNLVRTNGNFYSADAAGGTLIVDNNQTFPAGVALWDLTTATGIITQAGSLVINHTLTLPNAATDGLIFSGQSLTLGALPSLGAAAAFTANSSSSLTLTGTWGGNLTFPAAFSAIGTLTLNIPGRSAIMAGPLTIGNAGAGGLALTAGTLNTGAFTLTLNASTLSRVAGDIDATTATSVVVIGANGPASIPANTIATGILESLTIQRAGSVAINSDLTVGQAGPLGTLTLNMGLATRYFDLNGHVLTLACLGVTKSSAGSIDATATGSSVVVTAAALPTVGLATQLGQNGIFRNDQVYNLTLGAGSLILAATAVLDVTNLLNNAGTLDFGTNAATLKINNQPTAWGTLTTATGKLEINGSSAGAITLPNQVISLATFTMNRTATDGGCTVFAAQNLTVTNQITLTDGVFTIASGQSLILTNAGTVTTALAVASGASILPTQGIFSYTGASALTLDADIPELYDLTNGAGAISLAGNLIVGNTLTLGAGLLNVGAYQLTLNKAIGGTVNSLTTTASSKLVLQGSSAGDITLGTGVAALHTLIINRTDATGGVALDAGGATDLTISNTFTLTDGDIDFAVNDVTYTGETAGFTIGTGTITTGAANALIIGGTTTNLTLPANLASIENLKVNRTGSTVTLGGDLSVTNTLTAVAGYIAIGANTLTLIKDVATTPALLIAVPSPSTSSLTITGAFAADFNIPAQIVELKNLKITKSTNTVISGINGLTVNDTLDLSGAATLVVGANRTFTYTGNYYRRNQTNVGGFSFGTNAVLNIAGSGSTLTFPTLVGAATTQSFQNVNINRANGITLSEGMNVAKILTLTSGDIDLNGDKIIDLGTSAGSLVETAGNTIKNTGIPTTGGYITAAKAAVTSATTDATNFAGLGIGFSNLTGDMGATTVKRFHTARTIYGTTQGIKRYFNVVSTTPIANTTLTYYWDQTELNSLTEANLKSMSSADASAGPWALYATNSFNNVTYDFASRKVIVTGLPGFDATNNALRENWTLATPTVLSIGNLTRGLAGNTLVASRTNQGILGFSASATGTTNITQVVVNLDHMLAGTLTNIRLYSSTDDNFTSTTDNTLLATGVVSGVSPNLVVTFSSLAPTQTITSTTGKNYFVAADVAATSTTTTDYTTPLIKSYNITLSAGVAAYNILPNPAINYSFVPGIKVTDQLVNGISSTPLTAGELNKALFGFTLKSTGTSTPSLEGMTISASSDPRNVFTGVTLYKTSGTTWSLTGATSVATGTMTATGITFDFTATPETINATGINYFIVANAIKGGVQRNSPSIALSILQSNFVTGDDCGPVYPDSTITGKTFDFDILKVALSTNVSSLGARKLAVGMNAQQTIFGFTLTPDLSALTAAMNGVTVNFKFENGALPANLSDYNLYYDANNNGIAEASELLVAGVATNTSTSNTKVTFTSTIAIDAAKNFLVGALVATGATNGGLITGRVQSATDVALASPARIDEAGPFTGYTQTLSNGTGSKKLVVIVTPTPVVPVVAPATTNVSIAVQLQYGDGTPCVASASDGNYTLASTATLDIAATPYQIVAGDFYKVVTGNLSAVGGAGATNVSVTATSTGTYTAGSQTGITILASQTATLQENTILTPTPATLSVTIPASAWTIGSGQRRLLVIRQGQAPVAPTNGIDYVPTANLRTAGDVGSTQTAAGSVVVWDNATAPTANLTITGLMPNTTYYLQAFGYFGQGAKTNYLTTIGTGNPISFTTTVGTGDGFNAPEDSLNAAGISTDVEVHGLLQTTTTKPVPQEWFTFNVPTGRTNLRIDLWNIPSTKNYYVELYSYEASTGVMTLIRKGSNYMSSRQLTTINEITPGTYYLKIYGASASDYSPSLYKLKVSTSPLEFFSLPQEASK